MIRSISRSSLFVIFVLLFFLVGACGNGEEPTATTVPATATESEPTQAAEPPVQPVEPNPSSDDLESSEQPFDISEVDPAAAEHFQSAMGYFDENQFVLGLQEFDQAIEIEPDFAWAYAMRCVAHAQSAAADSEMAYALDPGLFQTLNFSDLGVLRTIMDLPVPEGYEQRAVEHFDNARMLVESGDWNFSEGNQGDQLQDNIDQIQWSLVFEELNQAITLEPRFTNAYLMRSVISSLLSMFDYQKAIELDPTIPEVIERVFDRIVDELEADK